jgi:DNA-binding IclR family transcriptional regulator
MHRRETQSLERGLQVLASLVKAGALTAAEAAHTTGLARATVRRLLNTLHAAGYVSQTRSHQPYRITSKLAAMAAQVPERARILEAARLAIADIPRSYAWPVAFIHWDGVDLVVSETTAERPQFEPTHFIPGWRLKPPFGAAAFVLGARGPLEVRQALLQRYRTSKLKKAKDQRAAFEAALSTPGLRKAGAYVTQTVGRQEFSIAVPVVSGGNCIGALETRVVSGAIARAGDRQKIIAALTKFSGNIAREFGAM